MGAVFFIIFVIFAVVFIASIALLVLRIITNWKLYEKAGEPGWASLIPVYNSMIFSKIAVGNQIFGVIYAIFSLIYSVGYSILSFTVDKSGDLSDTSAIAMIGILVIFGIPMLVINGYLSYMFAKSYGQHIAICILSIFFGQYVFIALGFSKSVAYVGPKGIPTGYGDYY